MTDFSLLICVWYRRNKRDLPWRETKNPYFLYLSEIILQQTRVEQGKNYYLKFIKNYPTIKDLAKADEQQILNDWQGLGYYSRARNLHETAKFVTENFNAVFPNKYEDILKLKGIGDYTAAAIASFSFDLPYSVLDGNVFRVLSRIFDIDSPIDSGEGKRIFKKLAQDLLPIDNPAEYNQAIMEFGAIHCLPKNPKCETCIFVEKCLSFKSNTISSRPLKIGKTKVRKRFFHYFIFKINNQIAIRKRENDDIWKHLYEFPYIEFESEQDENEIIELIQGKFNLSPKFSIISKKHILSHQQIFPTFWIFELENDFLIRENFDVKLIKLAELENFPLPRLIDRFLEENYQKLFINFN
jgi:A/G-specific adenine glycosylase